MCSTMVSCTKSEDIPYICYTADESLTTFDIEFLSTSPQVFQEVRHSKYNLGSIPQTNQALKGWGDEPYPLLWIQKDLDSARYLCLYTYEDAFKSLLVTIDRIFNTKLSAKYFVWYRFDCDIADIPLEMDGKSLLNSFFICDSVIKKDLISGTEYNINSTFYLQLGPDPVQLKTYYPFLVAWENLLYWRSAIETDDLVNGSQHIFFTEYAGDKKSNWGYDGRLYIDEAGTTYLHFWVDYGSYLDGEAREHDYVIQRELGDYYDILLPYFERLEELEPESEEYQAIGIKLNIVEEILFGNTD